MPKSKILSFGVVALIVFACTSPEESLMDEALKSFKNYYKIMTIEERGGMRNLSADELKEAVQVLDALHKEKRAEFAKAIKDNCTEAEQKILKQVFSCEISAKDEAELGNCLETWLEEKGNCEKAWFAIRDIIHAKVDEKLGLIESEE